MTQRPPVPQPPRQQPPRLFALYRDVDTNHKSGTGVVAWGVIWPDGRCTTWWAMSPVNVHQITDWLHINEIGRTHGHGLKTRVVTLGQAAAVEQFDTQPLRRLVHNYQQACLYASADSVAHLLHAMAGMVKMPGLLDAHDHLAAAYAQQAAALEAASSEIARLQEENAAMQASLDVIADTANQEGTTRP